jgi:hypothetical protein
LSEYFDISLDTAAEIVRTLVVVHPYGSLGRLSWEGGDVELRVGFGSSVVPHTRKFELCDKTINQLSTSILTFDEAFSGIDEMRSEIANALNKAQKIVFLGFAFHEQNMDLLSGCSRDGNDLEIFGSCLGFSVPAADAMVSRLRRMFPNLGGRVYFEPLKAAQLFPHYQGMLN